jgi:hypothetical protein
MSDLYLNLRDKVRVIDFLAEHLEYATPAVRKEAEQWIQAYEDEEKVHTDKLAEVARSFAWAIWPARYAVNRYFSTDGSEEEWVRVLDSIRPSTAHILKRFRRDTAAKNLDETLTHIESDVAFTDGDRREIAEVREHLRQDAWKTKQDSFEILRKEGERLVQSYRNRLSALRELMVELPRSLQDEVVLKVERYEDRILFEGEAMPLETFDEEIKYYTEQKEISPLDN